MNCPYCAEAISDAATVCKTCRRDVSLALSLKEANRALEQRVQELEAQLAELGPAPPREPEPPPVKAPPPAPPSLIDLVAIYVLLPTVVLIAAHYLLIARFDAKLIWLRAASILLPAIFGWMLQHKLRGRWYVPLAFGIVVGLAAVFGMSTTVHFTDGDPILPRNGTDWRETMEYSTSIALSYLLGALLRRAMQPLTAGAKKGRIAELALQIAHIAAGKHDTPKSLEQRVQRMIKLINMGISAATAIGAIYTGFKGIL